ncbi:MAG: HEAT repeat domain-containing protein [Planctomycetota bacterium]|jgi:hypothetical protein
MARLLIGGLLVLLLSACSTTQEEEIPFSDPPTFLKEEVRERIASIPYLSEEKLYDNLMRLVYIGEPAIAQVLEGIEEEDPRTRGSCAFVLGLIRDRRTIRPLEDALDDPVASVRYEVATALGQLGVPAGYPVLIDGLSDDSIRNRFKAHEALTLLTSLDFGYEHDASPSDRADAVRRWQEWYEALEAAQPK